MPLFNSLRAHSQERMVKAAAQGPFREATERIQEIRGVSVPKHSLEEVIEDAAQRFDAFYAACPLEPRTQTGPIRSGGGWQGNRTHMRYAKYLAQGSTIATGVVEGACKNLIKDRMERSGMRWTKAMAEAIVKLLLPEAVPEDECLEGIRNYTRSIRNRQRACIAEEVLQFS